MIQWTIRVSVWIFGKTNTSIKFYVINFLWSSSCIMQSKYNNYAPCKKSVVIEMQVNIYCSDSLKHASSSFMDCYMRIWEPQTKSIYHKHTRFKMECNINTIFIEIFKLCLILVVCNLFCWCIVSCNVMMVSIIAATLQAFYRYYVYI